MSKFDDFAKSAASGDSVFGAWRKTRDTADSAGMSRRDLMKKAGIVGAATVWATPLVQSVAAPMAAASVGTCVEGAPNTGCGGTCPKCSNGTPCTTGSDCLSGACGYLSTCAPANGSACSGTTQAQKDSSCASGYCNGSNVCAAPPTVALKDACHGATPTTAGCQDGAICSPTSGTCLYPTTHSCQNNNECASGLCQQNPLAQGKICA